MKDTDVNTRRNQFSVTDMGRSSLQADCENCFGFCCVALYFSISDGFPANKEAGKPCHNLQPDFRCRVHKNLINMGLKGCIAYDCFGAGQKVAQVTYEGNNWREIPEYAQQMFDNFLIMKQLHEMIWYLTEAIELQTDNTIREELNFMINKTEQLTYLSAISLLKLDVPEHREAVNKMLRYTSELVRNQIRSQSKTNIRDKKFLGRGLDLIGADLRKIDLRGENLSGAYLIAADLRGVDLTGADLLGADLRDADVRGTDLSNGIFLTQVQINSAKGDSHTKLPGLLTRPIHW